MGTREIVYFLWAWMFVVGFWALGVVEAAGQTGTICRVLAASPHLRLHAGGDTLTLSYDDTNSKTPDEVKMTQLDKIGMQLARELQG